MAKLVHVGGQRKQPTCRNTDCDLIWEVAPNHPVPRTHAIIRTQRVAPSIKITPAKPNVPRNGSHKLPEGGHWKPERVVIIEFPDMDAFNAWYTAPEYQPLIKLRKGCTSGMDMLIRLEGVT
jgi:uncharacterized protein (DUF1330 family)